MVDVRKDASNGVDVAPLDPLLNIIASSSMRTRAYRGGGAGCSTPRSSRRGGSNGEKSALANVIERALLEDENGCRVELRPSAPYGPDRVGTFAKRSPS